MRRKTKAKRILDYDNEEDEEEDQKLDALSHDLQKRRKQMHPAKEKAEENSSSATGLQKFNIGVPEFDGPPANHFTDNNSSPEPLLEGTVKRCQEMSGRDVGRGKCLRSASNLGRYGHLDLNVEADYLQSCSKMELIAMVLCMQREMENLREQIRCLTACGKLARHLEALIEKTQMWSNRDSKSSVPVVPSMASGPVQIDTTVPSLLTAPAVVNGQWPKQESPPQKPQETSQRNRLFTEFITPELLERCNTGTTAQKLTNDLLRGLYERDCLASHSISGVVYNKRGQPKPALPTEEVQAILRTVQYFFPGKTDAEIKGYIRQKLQNEAKRLRKKPSASERQDSRSPGMAVLRASSVSTSVTGQRPSVD